MGTRRHLPNLVPRMVRTPFLRSRSSVCRLRASLMGRPATAQQPQQAVIGRPPQAVIRRQLPRRLEQFPDLLVAIQVGVSPPRPVRQQTGWWHLGAGIMSTPMARKPANETEPPGPFGGTRILVLLRPFHRQR